VRLRPLVTVSLAALSAVLLAGCAGPAGGPESPSASAAPVTNLCDAMASSGAASEAVAVEGESGVEPEVSFESPLAVDDLQVTVLDEGDGDPIEAGDYISFAFNAYSADTGEPLGTLGYEPGQMLPSQISAESGLGQLLGCSAPGTRVVATFPASEATDTSQAIAAEVYVLDLLSVVPTAAWGEPQDPVSGMPVVTLADDGAPSVEIPSADAPTDLQIAVLKKGDGEPVKSGDTTMLQYHGVEWATGESFDSSWTKNGPYVNEGNQYIQGFNEAIEGQPAGSQILVVIPPELGYGLEESDTVPLGGKTLVFVIDILATMHAAS
jgi:peptidylprolyl isomerase